MKRLHPKWETVRDSDGSFYLQALMPDNVQLWVAEGVNTWGVSVGDRPVERGDMLSIPGSKANATRAYRRLLRKGTLLEPYVLPLQVKP